MECSQIEISVIYQGKELIENIWQGRGSKPTLKMSEWTSVRHIHRRANQISSFQLGDRTLIQYVLLYLRGDDRWNESEVQISEATALFALSLIIDLERTDCVLLCISYYQEC